MEKMYKIGQQSDMECHGISDHGFIDSIYFRDPNGYVIELTAERKDHDEKMIENREPHEILKN